MEYRRLSEELCRAHLDSARVWNRICEDNSTRGEYGVLLWLMLEGEGAYSMDIARHFDLTAGRVANILRQLEAKGYIARVQDREDLRRAKIVLTEKGRTQAKDCLEDMIEGHRALIEKLGEEDARTFVRIVKKALG
ncbi:MAG: MarR family transcriptional regulator [Clostridiales bacterium]|nr:MarR family transcriptional regulator [Clostridiales bacterium]